MERRGPNGSFRRPVLRGRGTQVSEGGDYKVLVQLPIGGEMEKLIYRVYSTSKITVLPACDPTAMLFQRQYSGFCGCVSRNSAIGDALHRCKFCSEEERKQLLLRSHEWLAFHGLVKKRRLSPGNIDYFSYM